MRLNARHVPGAAAVSVFALLLVLAVAPATANKVVKKDDAGDAPSPAVDIRKVVAAHAGDGRLRHVVGVADASGKSLERSGIFLKAKRKAYFVGVDGVVRTDGKKMGQVKGRRKGNNLILTFKPTTIGKPNGYRWIAIVYGDDSSSFDIAPNKGFARHNLRR